MDNLLNGVVGEDPTGAYVDEWGNTIKGLSRVVPNANAFTGFPAQYEGMSRSILFQSALAQPLSMFSTLGVTAQQGVLDSFYLGSLIKKIEIDPGAPQWANRGESPESYFARRDAANPMSEDEYKASAYYRDGVPWDPGMTATRAAALADWYDAKAVREFYAQKRPFTAFVGGLMGQALDPINYVPVMGEGVKAAQLLRFGAVGGRMLTGAADAALNTGIASVLTSGERARYGDDVSWQATVSSMAMAALLGGAFGAVHGAIEGRAPAIDTTLKDHAEQSLSTLKNVQEARIALNEGIDAVVHGEDANLSPNSIQPLERITQEVQRIEATRRATVDATPVTNPATMADVAQSYQAVATAHPELDPTASPSSFDSLMIAHLQANGFDSVSAGENARPMPLSFNPATLDLPAVMKKPLAGEIAPEARPNSQEFSSGLSRLATKVSDAKVTELAQRYEIGNRMHNRLVRWLDDKTGIGLGFDRFRNHEMLPQLIAYHQRELQAAARPIDTQRAKPVALPEGRQEALARVSKPEDPKSLAAQFHIDPNTGAFREEADLHQLAAAGRLTDEDITTMAEAHVQYDQAAAYGEALKSLASCLV